MSYCDECIHLKYEADVNAAYCDLDLPEPEHSDNEDDQIQCYEYDTGEQDEDCERGELADDDR